MKLLYIENIRLPTEKAHGYQIMQTCAALVKQGIEVELVVADRKNPLKEQDAFKYYNIDSHFPITRLPVTDLIPHAPRILQPVAFWLERTTFLRSLRRYLQTHRAQIVYTRDVHIARFVKQLGYGPVVLELHALPTTLTDLSVFDAVVCVTDWMAEQVRQAVPALRVETIRDAFDPTCFSSNISSRDAREELGLSLDKTYITYGGRFSTMGAGKGLGLVDEAVSSISSLRSDVELLLVGGTAAEFARLEGRTPSQTTTCIPAVPREQLALYYRASNVLVMSFPDTKHYAYEMSPLKLFEYMASERPIITSDLPSIREVLTEEDATFFHASDVADLERAIVELLADSKRQEEQARHAHRRVTFHTWLKRAEDIKRLLQTL